MKRLLALTVAAILACGGSYAWAANSVVVESGVMGPGAVDCPIHVLISNDQPVQAMAIPLVIREVTPGAYISALRLTWDDRLPLQPDAPLYDIRVQNQYADPDGTCKPGGFQTQTWTDTEKHSVAASPEGALFAAVRIFGADLSPGSDNTGSLVMTVDVGTTTGTFEIDTTCIDPNNHLDLIDENGVPLALNFTKGTISIEPNDPPVAVCRNVTVPAGPGCEADASIDGGSYDPDGDAITLTQVPSGPYPLGQNIVRLIVQDGLCTADTCEAVVTVIDETPPVVTCPADTIIAVDVGSSGAIVEFAATATDNCSEASVVCNPPSGSFFPLGISTVTCVGTDAAQNADTCSFLVAIGTGGGYCNDRPEDVNCDGQIDIFDMGQIIDVLFTGQAESGPCCHTKK